MLSVATARQVILDFSQPLAGEILPLSSAALGCVLGETVSSDLDVPPFAKALMDGYALRSADLISGFSRLLIIEEVLAGQFPTKPIHQGQATRIMTGAPLPVGADAVVAHEKTRLVDSQHVLIEESSIAAGSNVLHQGEEMQKGEMILPSGTVLRPQEFGILATIGKSAFSQIPPPKVSIISTGDELVESPMMPGPGQIRNSNAPMLLAQVANVGGLPRYLGIAEDKKNSLFPLIQEGLQTSHIVILSGGVSAGKVDLVPEVLQEVGVITHIHKVHLKPGKPFLFGTCDKRDGRRLIFGLPGNPVSSMVCFELFIRPAIRTLAGRQDIDLPMVKASLTNEFTHRSDRPTYHPGKLESTEIGWTVRALPWLGSADLRAFSNANALVVFPAGDRTFTSGESISVLRLDS